jgi:NADH-quinone oxidoreductase subunit C
MAESKEDKGSEAAAETEENEPVTEPEPEPATRYGVPLSDSRGQVVLHPSREGLVDFVRTLRDDEDFRLCNDLTAVDYLAYNPPRDLPDGVGAQRFEVVIGLLSLSKRERVRLRVQVPADDPSCPSLFDVHPGTEAFEREVFDMFGIRFDGHPDLTRILMPEEWEGHPLRKDYPVGAIPVQFKGTSDAR